VAIYSTFLNRAFDQVLLDVALHRLPVTIVLDRAGITGPDGPSHHGMWDLAALGTVPGLRLAAPRDEATLQEELREAVAEDRGPTVLRFPKASVGTAIPAVDRIGGLDVLRAPTGVDVLGVPAAPRVLIVSIGAMADAALQAASVLAARGLECTVVDPRWVRPVNPEIVALAADHELVVTVEDGVRGGGVGAAIAQTLADADVNTPVKVLGLPTAFIAHGGRQRLLADHGLDAAGIAAAVVEYVDRVDAPALNSRARLPIRTPLAAVHG
jgi:1-deoxy-D-xylulose-5-phosphate synthase